MTYAKTPYRNRGVLAHTQSTELPVEPVEAKALTVNKTGEVAVLFQMHLDDPEHHRHQMLAALVYEGNRAEGDPPWSELPRRDRIGAYGLTDGLV
jgi:hypothetical protein